MVISNNAYFKDSAAKVTKLGEDIKLLNAAETGCNTKPPTVSVEIRNAVLETVKADLEMGEILHFCFRGELLN